MPSYNEIMKDLATVLPTKDISSKRWRQLYHDHLSHIDPDLLNAAARYCIRHCFHFPRIAELLEACRLEIMRRENIPAKEVAWHEIQEHITSPVERFSRAWNQHSRPAFSHPVIARTWATIDGDSFLHVKDETPISYKKQRWDEVYARILDDYLDERLAAPSSELIEVPHHAAIKE